MMNSTIRMHLTATLSVVLALCSIIARGAASKSRVASSTEQDANDSPAVAHSDPLAYLTKSFPHTVQFKQNGHLLEFCPDNTCDGFVSSKVVPVATIKDFAYLYIYFFSEYTYLSDWRSHADAKDAVARLLSKPQYRGCRNENNREAARCVLLDLSRGGRIKLIFVRYDENRRNVVPEDIAKELSKERNPAE